MQIRATVSANELQEAERLFRPKSFWLRFFAANWYATIIGLLVIGVAINALIHHEHPKWGDMAVLLAICIFFLGFSWYRWSARLAKIANSASAKSGTVTLDTDGIRTTLATGGTTFVPWSSFNQWTEGKLVFLLRGNDATAILPIDDGNRESIRSILSSNVS